MPVLYHRSGPAWTRAHMGNCVVCNEAGGPVTCSSESPFFGHARSVG